MFNVTYYVHLQSKYNQNTDSQSLVTYIIVVSCNVYNIQGLKRFQLTLKFAIYKLLTDSLRKYLHITLYDCFTTLYYCCSLMRSKTLR